MPRPAPLKPAVVALVLACLSALPGRAAAAPQSPDDGCLADPVCRGHYEQAVALFEQSRFDVALPEFQAAYEQRQMPWLLINIGRTLHRLGRPKEALERYERYTKAEPRMDAETRQRLDKYIAQARSSTPLTDAPTAKAGEGQPGDKTLALPLYKKWWFWTAIGGAAAAIVVTGVAVGVAVGRPSALPSDVMVYRPGF